VCAELFLVPLLTALQGGRDEPTFHPVPLLEALTANGPRDHYMRACVVTGIDGRPVVRALPDQDSSLVSILAEADGLLRRPPFAPALVPGDLVPVLALDR